MTDCNVMAADNNSRKRTEARQARMQEVMQKRQDDLTLILSNIHDPHNVSASYRSCDAFGASEVNLYYTSTPFPALGSKSSASARKWVTSKRHRNADALFADLKARKFQILATSFGPGAKSYLEWDMTVPTAIILGNEHAGVEDELRLRADGEIYIPMLGMIQSLNVSVAAAVILAEAARQRQQAGLYARCRIPDDEFAKRLDEWLAK